MEEYTVQDAIRDAGMDLTTVDVSNAIPLTVREQRPPETPPKKRVEPPKKRFFRWQDSLKEMNELFKTGRPVAKDPPMKEKKKLKWPEIKEGAEKLRKSLKRPLPTVDFSCLGLEDFLTPKGPVVPRIRKEKAKRNRRGMLMTTSIRFANNRLGSLGGLDSFLQARFADPSRIGWLDLSYNKISEIEPVLSMLPHLTLLYLHCNCIEDLDEVRKLRHVHDLRTLTLYGNPIEAKVDYRLKIVAALGTIKRLDLSLISPMDRQLAKRYSGIMIEKDRLEAEEIKRQMLANEAQREKELKALEKKKKRQEEQAAGKEEVEEHIAEVKSEAEAKDEETVQEDSEESQVVVPEEPEKLEKEPEEKEEEEVEETIVPADLTDWGPLDVKGKRKLNPDCITETSATKQVSPCSSAVSLFSAETVDLEQIREEFQELKEREEAVGVKCTWDSEYFW